MASRVLCIGDVHLGKAPGSLSPRIREEYEGDLASIGPECAWDRAIEAAIEHEVDAVLMVGDVVHEENDSWRVESIIEKGVRRLHEKDIRILSVLGNHDASALPRVADSVPELELLGRNANWELATLHSRKDGTPFANVLGWSFRSSRHKESPLLGIESFSDVVERALPTIGLLHCDLDATELKYAPVARTALENETFVHAWLLGHFHTASFEALRQRRPIGYLGALSPLKRTDRDRHGAWLLSVDGMDLSLEMVVPAPLRFDEVRVDVSALRSEDELQRTIRAAIESHLSNVDTTGLDVFGACVRVCGRSKIARQIRDQDAEAIRSYLFEFGSTKCFISDYECEVRSAVDLERLAGSSSAAGLLAKEILLLEDEGSGWRQIVDEARPTVEKVRVQVRDRRDAPDAEELRVRLADAGRRALDELLATRGDDDAL